MATDQNQEHLHAGALRGLLHDGDESAKERSPRVRCEVRELPDGTVVRIHGELDLDSIDGVQRVLAEAAARTRVLTLDLRDVEFIDSSGLNLMVQMAALANADGFEFAVTRPTSAAVQRLFEVTGAGRYLTFVEAGDTD